MQIGQPDLMLPRSMFINPDRYKTQIDAYSKLIAGTVFLVHEEFGSGRQTRGRGFEDEIADEIITFEAQLAKVLFRIIKSQKSFSAFTRIVHLFVYYRLDTKLRGNKKE